MQSYQPRPELSGIDASGPAKDRYSIVGRIASGAMGQVYLAQMQRRSGRAKEVAVKRIRPELQIEKDVVAMFYDEARIASKMDHPNIIRIYELGELDGSLFIAMELIEGINLSGLLRHLVEKNRPLPAPVMFKITLDILDALDYAHRFTDTDGRSLNIVHRDVSPQNIMLSYAGDVKLFDFGVTKAEGRLHKTHPGLLKGKLAYMAPEQIRGDVSIDARADLFSLGALLYEALLYRHPFYGKTDAMVLRAIMESDPIHPHEIDPRFSRGLTEILFTALAKDPAQRFRDAREMSDALEAFMTKRNVTATRALISDFLHHELAERIAALDHARKTSDDDAIVAALRGGPAAPSSSPQNALVSPPVRRALPEPRERALLPPPRTKAKLHKGQSARIPDGLGVPISTTRLHLAEAATGDLPMFEGNETQDIPPMVRSSLKEELEDEFSRETVPPPTLVQKVGPYAVRKRLDDVGPFEAYEAIKYGPRGFNRTVLMLRPPEQDTSGLVLDALVRNAKASSAWIHPNLVATLDFGDDGTFYWIVEHTPGYRLDTVLDRTRSLGRAVPVGAACRIGAMICSALLHMHEHKNGGHVHLDVRPENLILMRSGAIKLGGFVFVAPVGVRVREPPVRVRTEYVAPEIIAGDTPTVAADVFGTGRTLDACLSLNTAARPATAGTSQLPSLATRSRDVPDRLVRAIDASLSYAPHDRAGHVAELHQELERALIDVERSFTTLDLARWLSSLYT